MRPGVAVTGRAAIAVVRLSVCVAVDFVVAVGAALGRLVAVADVDGVAHPAVERVGAVVAGQDVRARGAGQAVAAAAANHVLHVAGGVVVLADTALAVVGPGAQRHGHSVGATGVAQGVGLGAAVHGVAAVGRRALLEDIVGEAVEDVVARLGLEDVVARAAVQCVDAAAAVEGVDAAVAVQGLSESARHRAAQGVVTELPLTVSKSAATLSFSVVATSPSFAVPSRVTLTALVRLA